MVSSGKLLGRLCGVGIVAAGVLLLGPAAAGATPPDQGVTGEVIWQKKAAGTQLTLRRIVLPPGTDTGWHYHDGPLFAKVKRGTLSHFDSSCRPDGVHRAGERLSEPSGSGNVHIGRNLGPEDLVLEVLYVMPAGSPLVRDAPNPGCAFE